jgi:broad specificity phosphatase PhoE
MSATAFVPDTRSAHATPAPDAPARAAVRVQAGAIILARHGEPALSRRVKLDAAGYRRWWATYEEGGLLRGQTPPADLAQAASRCGQLFSSIRPRSIETARAIAGPKPFQPEQVFIEAPLPPPNLPRFIRLSPRAWGVVARTAWWFFNHHAGEESRRQATIRARRAARRLIKAAACGEDVLVVAHGFFNAMIGRELRKLGWRCVSDQGYRYWCAQRFERA